MARSRSTPSRTIRSTPSDVTKRGPVSDILIVSTLFGSNPGSTAPSATDVRIRSAEPTSSTSASATSSTTSSERALFCLNPVPERLRAFLDRRVRDRRASSEGGNQADQNAGTDRGRQRERQHPPVHRDARAVQADARQARGVDRQQRADADRAEQQPEHSTESASTTLSVSS